MSSPKPDEEVIFKAARVLPPGESRDCYLVKSCGGDEALLRRVRALLQVDEEEQSFLAAPAVCPAGDDTRTGAEAPDADESLDFLAPSDKAGSLGRLGHYEVQGVVGRGGMGVVLKAFDETLHRVVAVKVMAPQLAASTTARRRFTREARAAAAVSHDHVVTIHAVEEADRLPYIVMQYVAGVSLQDRLDRTGPLPLAEVLRIGAQTASGLAAAHAQGLVHRDVKPANILLENGVERVKITDFGLARAADDASLTQSGMIAGTPQYMSPEQAEGRPVNHLSDLFGLGSVLYAMCAGRPPFRGSTSRAVLKRVVEDAPPPVREANPEVPDWLVDVITKLHAKDPSERFQTAAEVAEVLGRYLAHVQHPLVVPPPAVAKPAEGSPAPARPLRNRRRLAAVSMALVALVAILGTTEATGVTNVRATAVRIFTPEGTLVVETDDPAVKVTVEGGGDLVITGAGPQEVRLRAGSYRLRATKDGKPVKLDRDLVAISRGNTQVVRVRLEDAPPAAVAVPTAEPGAFVLLGGRGVAERKFGTLAEAVRAAGDGDTVEVRGNGPFLSGPIKVGRVPLTIRAGPGFRPVILMDVGHVRKGDALLDTNSTLCLEGLELHAPGRPPEGVGWLWPMLIQAVREDARLFVANCRFVAREMRGPPIRTSGAAVLDVRNCQFATSGNVIYSPTGESRFVLRNNVLASEGIGLALELFRPELTGAAFDLEHNTLVAPVSLQFYLDYMPDAVEEKVLQAVKLMRVRASGNLFDGTIAVLRFEQSDAFVGRAKKLSVAEMEHLLRAMSEWGGARNGFPAGSRLLALAAQGASLPPTRSIQTVAEWDAFWGAADTGSVQGTIRYLGGNVSAIGRTAPESLTPEDFRLRPDSTGYRAGKDGKDLGADVDLVGPGTAYERWKKTAEYSAWLKESGQVKK
jgi:hypothetical protein